MKPAKLFIVTAVVLLFCEGKTLAQKEEQFDLESFIEELFNLQEEDINYEDLYESLLTLYQNPLNLNTANAYELQSLYILSSTQIQNLQNYIEQTGKLITLYELKVIEGFDYATIERLKPFVTVNSKDALVDERPLLQRILEERNNYIISRYERILNQKKGNGPKESPDDSRYAGSADKFYLRYRVSKPNDFSIGFTTEKDAGEQLHWSPKNKTFFNDFWSAHIMIENQGKWQKLIIGDYQLQFGQGLLFGAGFGVGKGSETVNTANRVTLGIKPYTSVLEGGFLRGAAASYVLNKKLNATVFISNLKQDADIQMSDNTEDFDGYFSSLQLTGMHRTPTELANKKQVAETVLGMNLNFRPNDRTEAGFIISTNHFSVPMLRSDKPYNKFEFKGQSNLNMGMYGRYQWQHFLLFGESAVSKSGGLGAVGGFATSLTPRVEFAMVLRSYQKNFHTFRGTSFAEGSRNINEKGVYWGIKYTLNRKFYLTAYYDTYHFPWLRFGVDTPSNGHDYLLRLNYNPGSRIKLYGQFRSELKDINFNIASSNNNVVVPGRKDQYLIHWEYASGIRFSFKSRIQFSEYHLIAKKTKGYAFIQDAVYKNGAWAFSARMALFDTEGSQNKQYAYERDVLYAFSIPAYSGQGIRNYLLIQYRAFRKMDLWARIAKTTYYDRDEIGTGLETINGNKRTEVKFQVRYKLN
ncbi:helix-hairpin-helix domain-containing protein [Roseivirga sp.]|uniref:ComEA family DNA-binding protein n=1 Tax=Roseivirga sp. TaxID=1964215 RepID=UPI002B2702A6|nr:helix-hairpin-helix domain-containing protein [Roseivirga sp.]